MARRRHDEPQDREREPPPFHAPFRGLGAKLASRPAPPARQRAQTTTATASRSKGMAGGTADVRAAARRAQAGNASSTTTPDVYDDDSSFARAMADVRRLDAEGRVDAPAPALHIHRAPSSEEAEALAALSDLVAGSGEFDVSDSVEYIEGAVVGLDPRILRRLRRGEFAYQAYVDLHGVSTAAARVEVERFVLDAFAAGHRAVLVIHGRGLNSKDNVPVLKERLKSWLARGRIGRIVLAFSSARPADGGAGALYVLLRRRRGVREPIAVFEGAKRE